MKMYELFEKRKIFLDLDGCFADFAKAAKALHGQNYNELEPKKFWKPISYEIDNFFAKLDPFPWTKSLYREICLLPNVHVEFLTALPYKRGKLVTVEEDKINWVHRYIDPKVKVNTIIGGKNKGKFCKSSTDILIDDTQRNIDAWKEAGGIGILFRTPAQVLSELEIILNV